MYLISHTRKPQHGPELSADGYNFQRHQRENRQMSLLSEDDVPEKKKKNVTEKLGSGLFFIFFFSNVTVKYHWEFHFLARQFLKKWRKTFFLTYKEKGEEAIKSLITLFV